MFRLTPQAAENANALAQPVSGFAMTWFVILPVSDMPHCLVFVFFFLKV
jgi:hypothetical protein